MGKDTQIQGMTENYGEYLNFQNLLLLELIAINSFQNGHSFFEHSYLIIATTY